MRMTRRAVIGGSVGATLAPSAAFAERLHLHVTQIGLAANAAIEAGGSPGVQTAVMQEGRVAHSRGYGLANLETRSAMTPASVFRIASLSKQFTAAAAIKLASAGILELGATVSRYLPFMQRLPAMTLMELMHHTAGLHSDETSLPLHAGAASSQIVLAEEIAAQQSPLDFEPGTAWLYSNANYIVLGAAIEAATHKPFAQAMSDLVFAPLGLAHTAIDHTADVVAGRVSGYTPAEAPARFQNAAPLEVSDAGGAGALRSTALDLCRWRQGLLSGRLFGEREIALMTTPGRLRDGRVSGAHRFSPQDAQYGEVQYACGLLVSPPDDPHPSLFHYGYINGFACMLQTFTSQHVTLAVLCNGDVGPATPFREIRRVVTDALT